LNGINLETKGRPTKDELKPNKEKTFEAIQWLKDNYPEIDRLAKEQRILSRRKKGSTRWEKQRLKVAKLQEKTANQRKNFLHHKSSTLEKVFMITVGECSLNSSNTSWNNKENNLSK
jgi:Probable transposase